MSGNSAKRSSVGSAGSWVAKSRQAKRMAGNVGQCSRLWREAQKAAACLVCSCGVMSGIESRAREVTPESCTRYASGLLEQLIIPKYQSHCKTQRLGYGKSIHIWVRDLSIRKKEDRFTWRLTRDAYIFTHQGLSYLLKKGFPVCWAREVRVRPGARDHDRQWLITFLLPYLLQPHLLSTFPFSPTFSFKLMFSVLSGNCEVRSQWFIVLALINSVYIVIFLWAKAIKSFMESVMSRRFFRHQKLEGEACKFSFFC